MKTVIAVATTLLTLAAFADAQPSGTDDEIRARIKPFGTVCKVGEDCGGPVEVVAAGGMSGAEVYDKFCFVCHNAGVGGAPLLQNAEQWAPRLDKGMDALMASTLNGLNAMPPKGTCMACSDDELAATVRYMSGSE